MSMEFPSESVPRKRYLRKCCSMANLCRLKRSQRTLSWKRSSDVLPAKEVWPALMLAIELCDSSASINQYPEQVWRHCSLRRLSWSSPILSEPLPNAKPYRWKHCDSGILSQTHPANINMQHTGLWHNLLVILLSKHQPPGIRLQSIWPRYGLDLPQINLSLIVDKDLGIPVMYDLYPGSIADVSTLKNTVKKIKYQGVRDLKY